MSKFATDTESIEHMLDHIESMNKSTMFDDDNKSNRDITELFKKILEAESSYKYMDMSELLRSENRSENRSK